MGLDNYRQLSMVYVLPGHGREHQENAPQFFHWSLRAGGAILSPTATEPSKYPASSEVSQDVTSPGANGPGAADAGDVWEIMGDGTRRD